MPRALPIEYPGAIYHVMNHGDTSPHSTAVVGRVTSCAPVLADGHHEKTARSGLTRPTQSGWMARSVLECGGPPPLLNRSKHTVFQSARGLAPSKTCRLALLLGFILLHSSFCLRAQGQYAIDWYKIAGGGGPLSGGNYSLNGTIGQSDASGAMSGGNYSVTGGFWSLISVVQTAGLPNLVITHSGSSVTVSWPNTGSYTLQQNANLALGNGWATSGYVISTANGTNRITLTAPAGNLFFRLQP